VHGMRAAYRGHLGESLRWKGIGEWEKREEEREREEEDDHDDDDEKLREKSPSKVVLSPSTGTPNALHVARVARALKVACASRATESSTVRL
jgi:hypothetical protein